MTDDERQRLEDRLVDLEVKLSWADDLLEQLNTLVARQQGQIDALAREVARLRAQAASGAPDAAGAPYSLRDELPPHY
jgi:SlyX protein